MPRQGFTETASHVLCCETHLAFPTHTVQTFPQGEADGDLSGVGVPGGEETARAEQLMSQAGKLLATGELAAIQHAIAPATEAVETLQKLLSAGVTGSRHSLAAAWLLKGNVLRETHDPGLRPDALAAYAHAVDLFQAVMRAGHPEDANHLANLWTNRGMTLLDDGGAAALTEALGCFERAIELRRQLPLETNPHFTWGLSAAWMNRADVLTRLGQTGQLDAALQSYDEAIQLLCRMPLDEHPTYRARLAVAWMNRGLAAQAQVTPGSLEGALRCFSQSIEAVSVGTEPVSPEQRRILSCAHLNRGHALLNREPAQPAPAREDALAALGLAVEFEQSELLAAQIGLQARHLLCRAVAHLLDTGGAPTDWVTETTDAVDEGMALARHWRTLGEKRLLGLEAELFRFGVLIYRLCLPHFLAEFLLESMDPVRSAGAPVAEEVMHHLAADALWSATLDLRAQQEADPSAENQARLLRRLDELHEAERRLTALRLEHLRPAS